jgi:LPS-assembly lipoprotein
MSSPDRMPRRALRAFALVGTLILGGCFRPMYATVSPSGVPLQTTLASVSMGSVTGRVAQQVRNNLDFGLTGGGDRPKVRYVLDLSVTSSRTTSIVEARTNEPEVDTVTVTADFTLTPIGSETPVFTGKNVATKSFDRTLQRFAALRAARDAEDSASRIVADQIRTRVAAWLAEHS